MNLRKLAIFCATVTALLVVAVAFSPNANTQSCPNNCVSNSQDCNACHVGYLQAGPRAPGYDNDCFDTGAPVADGTACPGGRCTAGACGP